MSQHLRRCSRCARALGEENFTRTTDGVERVCKDCKRMIAQLMRDSYAELRRRHAPEFLKIQGELTATGMYDPPPSPNRPKVIKAPTGSNAM